MKRMLASVLTAFLLVPFAATAQENLTHRPIDGIVEPANYRITGTSLEVCWENPYGGACRTLAPANGNGQVCPDNVFATQVAGYLQRNFDSSDTSDITNDAGQFDIGDFGSLGPLTAPAYVAITECLLNGAPTGIYALILQSDPEDAETGAFTPDGIFKLAGTNNGN